MRRLGISFACALAAAVLATGASAHPGHPGHQERHVSPKGADTGDCTKKPCRTIGYAVGVANAGDRIEVDHGTYAESVLVQKRLELEGHGATVDATGQQNGIVVDGAGAAGSEVRGFDVVNAVFEGILVQNTSHVTVSHNELSGNDTGFDQSPSPCQGSLDDCGEALHLAAVTRSTVEHNYVHDNVGGILLTDDVGAPGQQPTYGPTYGNDIRENLVLDNTKDCGITLASHFFRIGSPAAANEAGVYRNDVEHNVSNGAGAAGIGVFAGPPGAAAWGNRVAHNVAMHNGLPGVAIHSHTPFQYVNDNEIVDNALAANGPDDDAATGAPTGVVVFADVASGASPIAHTVVAGNHISDEHYGIWTAGATKVDGLKSNRFHHVDVPFAIH